MPARHFDHPIPADCRDPEYLSDGAYASHDGEMIWISCDRHDGGQRTEGFEAVALDRTAIEQLVLYAARMGWSLR